MENTFIQPRTRVRETEKLEAEKKPFEKSKAEAKGPGGKDAVTQTVEPTQAGTLVPAGNAGALTRVRTMAFQPSEVVALSRLSLNPDAGAAAPSFRLRVEETPAEFVHLYAGLERLVGQVHDLSNVTGNLLETGHPYLMGVTSAVAGEGKTTTALHLAMTIARSTVKRVCLVDLSLGADGPATRLGMPAGDGLVPSLEAEQEVVPCFTVPGCDGLTVIPGGRVPANPARFARSPGIAQFLVATRQAFDVVLVDLPAVSTENALPLIYMTDGVVMVVRAGVTPRHVVTEALEMVGIGRVSSVILNRARPSVPNWLRKRLAHV